MLLSRQPAKPLQDPGLRRIRRNDGVVGYRCLLHSMIPGTMNSGRNQTSTVQMLLVRVELPVRRHPYCLAVELPNRTRQEFRDLPA
jgi:hypothetical protein